MATVSLRRIKYVLGAGAILGISLLPQPPSAVADVEEIVGVCTEINLGNGYYYVDCGPCGYIYHNGVYTGTGGCGGNKPPI